MKCRYYLAYGSNVSIRQMGMRCPTAKPVCGVMLPNYELLFRGDNGSAVATIEPKDGGNVPCGLWLITPEDEASLDRYEGFPWFYHKEMVDVQLGEQRICVMVYVMNGGHETAIASAGYLRTILDGYSDFGLHITTLYAVLLKSL